MRRKILTGVAAAVLGMAVLGGAGGTAFASTSAPSSSSDWGHHNGDSRDNRDGEEHGRDFRNDRDRGHHQDFRNDRDGGGAPPGLP